MNAKALCEYYNLHSDFLTLPIRVNKGSSVFIELFERWDKFIGILKDTNELSACIPFAKKSIEYLKKAIDAFYMNEHESALKHIKSTIDYLLTCPAGSHLITNVDDLYIDKESKQWFRARTTDSNSLSIENIKHVPADSREKIADERYSMNGIPCLYLCNSILNCWEELNRPEINGFWVARYRPKNSIKVINLSTTGYELIHATKYLKYVNESDSSFSQAVVEYFCNWVLQSACSVVVNESNRAFREEYIIPQLITECIKIYNVDGVMYFSTKVEGGFTDASSWLSKNLAIPAYDVKAYGDNPKLYSPKIDSLFDISIPINLGMYANGIIPAGPHAFHESDNWARSHSKAFITKKGYNYSQTLFYKCEIELQHYFEK